MSARLVGGVRALGALRGSSTLAARSIFLRQPGAARGASSGFTEWNPENRPGQDVGIPKPRNDQKSLATGVHGQKKEFSREDVPKAKRVVIKVGTSVLTRDEEFGVSLTHLASLVEQVSELVHEGREVIIVTSGAVGFGKMRLQVQSVMSQTVRHTLSWGQNGNQKGGNARTLDSRACAATGQSGLMTLYDAMFSQYGVSIAQILVTMSDFQVDAHRANMCETIKELISLGIVPVCNENDVFYSNTSSREFSMSHSNTQISTFNPYASQDGKQHQESDAENEGSKVVRLTANDSLSALLAVELDAELMIVLTNVDGVYTAPPGRLSTLGATPKLISAFNPDQEDLQRLEYGRDRRVGRGGMAAKVDAAKFALNHGVNCIIANGHKQDVIQKIFDGKTVGTLFTRATTDNAAPLVRGQEARRASRELAALPAASRKAILERIAKQIRAKMDLILSANAKDVAAAGATNQPGFAQQPADMRKLGLSKKKLTAILKGIDQIASSASNNAIGKNIKWVKVGDGLYLEQQSVPLGVALCVFEVCTEVIPQVAALCIASGNAVIFKGSAPAENTTRVLHEIIAEALSSHGVSKNACIILPHREPIEDYLLLNEYIDLVIPRGGRQLIQWVNDNTEIPVLGDAEGLCHIYIHNDADIAMAASIILDSKVETSAGSYGVETLLVNFKLIENGKLDELLAPLTKEGVTVFAGPRLRAQFKSQTLKMPPARSLEVEYGVSAIAVEVVTSVEEAIEHINTHGSHHTDVIVSGARGEDSAVAREFMGQVESACVFHNCSTRFSDGFAFGLGAQVGVNCKKGPLRGPVGMEGLMTYRWTMKGKGHVTSDFSNGNEIWVHEKKCVTCGLQVRE